MSRKRLKGMCDFGVFVSQKKIPNSVIQGIIETSACGERDAPLRLTNSKTDGGLPLALKGVSLAY